MGRHLIHTTIFSKDRPAQLDLLIRSVRRYCPSFRPSVLVNASNERFLTGYSELANKLDVALYIEDNFENDLKKFILLTKEPYTQFLVDDQIAIRNPYENLDVIDRNFKSTRDLVSWSLRLGENSWRADDGINHQGDLIESLLETGGWEGSEYLLWCWADFNAYFPNCYYATPMSVDGNIFRSDFVADLVENLHFNGPNQLEGEMEKAIRKGIVDKSFHYSINGSPCVLYPVLMCAWPSPAFINSPNNRVQDEAKNSYGQVYPMSAEEMNKKYLEGYQLSLDFELPEIFAPHHELELKWEKV